MRLASFEDFNERVCYRYVVKSKPVYLSRRPPSFWVEKKTKAGIIFAGVHKPLKIFRYANDMGHKKGRKSVSAAIARIGFEAPPVFLPRVDLKYFLPVQLLIEALFSITVWF
ncbi:MAG: hypothetical protein LBJ61_10205 [Deltaproteobacteria bacterium]|jgi:hypothetical protein|nr:hypothetical protein [Deltaproteobacteria bacterium]